MKKITICLLILCSFQVFSAPKKVLMMVSEGFYAPEYYIPHSIFNNQGFHVTTATKYLRLTKPDERQLRTHKAVMPDLTFNQVQTNDYDAIVFAGGNGAWEDFFPNSDVHKILINALRSNKVVALLCSSTGLLALAGNLNGNNKPIAMGRKVTGYKRVSGLLIKLGRVRYSPGIKGQPHVVVDKNLITGRDPISSTLFAKTVVKALYR